MKRTLIASFDMEVGGVERSLISMLQHLDTQLHEVDVMLYSHSGDFLSQLPETVSLLDELLHYKTFRMSIPSVFKSGLFHLGLTRLAAKYRASRGKTAEQGYRQMQYMWKYALPFLPKLEQKYDLAISYLWPHYMVAEKVEAKLKIAWIHTDYSTVDTDIALDLAMWKKYDYIMAVSKACRQAFLQKYPSLDHKVRVMENISSPHLVRQQAMEPLDERMQRDKRFKLVTVARLSYAKGIDVAVEAMRLLVDEGYDISWYVIGYGGEEAKLKELIAERKLENHFFLLGKKLNPYPYMQAADIYVQPSRYEGKAVTVVEAQQLGRPVIITDYPTASSQVRDGQDGMICQSNPAGIAAGVRLLYHHRYLMEELERCCQQTNYDNSHEMETLYDLYREEAVYATGDS
ncbi:glycosyltransferase [Ornithinibacillus gellani]|uniref:glycosyltransferase n=1 Tax=Ornithinibacillus gellani TaxID=2293253 RepID=UPI000F4AD321|nr:glycosyltransferase [Ornithinibacillus gellani]TQS74127.1 glycosyltransferase [Ornithinibacillus gellani]